MSKQKSRTLSKAEREVITFSRIKNMSQYIEVVDKRLSNLEDDLSLLIALQVAEDDVRDGLIGSLREAAKQGQEALEVEGESNADNE